MIESLNNWWDGLSLVLKIFYGIGLVATTIVGVQTVLTLLGFDGHDADGDVADGHAGDGGHDGDFQGEGIAMFSIRTVTAFLVGFGWMGAFLAKGGMSLLLVIPIAGAVGFVFMLMIYFVMRLLWSMRDSGNLDYHNAVGEIGSVYLPIPGEKAGKGQIQVMVQGRLQTIAAMTSRPGRIENREKVLVVDVLEDNSLLVIPEE